MAEAAYERIVADIRRRIDSGELAAGARVPSTRRLVADYGVAMATATKALTALRRAGLVRPVPGVGTVVAAEPVPRPRATPTGAAGPRRDDIVRAAIALADAEGLAGVSMRRIATDLGIATMSMYRHVAGRDELVTLMLDRVLGERPLPAPPPAGWRAMAEACARTMWAGCRAHPWLAQAISMTRPQSIPNGMDFTEWLLAAFDGYGLDVDTRFRAGLTVLMFVRGIAVNLEPQRHAEQDTGLTDEEWMDTRKPAFQVIADPHRYPQLSALMHGEIDADLDSMFEFGLARLLDGLGTFLAGRH